jgi:hypothetical protein
LSPEFYCTDSKTFRLLNTQLLVKSIVAVQYDPSVKFSPVLPLALLLAYGIAFASAALGFSLIAFDDHPGQLYRLWHVVLRGPAPWTWNPGWWTGYPELQFYPPGFAYAGAVLHAVTRGAVSVPATYQALVWLAYLAPALTVWLLLRRVLGDGWAALPGAFVALTLSAGLGSGVEGGVHIGMVAARVGWAMLPLLPLALAGWSDGKRNFPWSVVLLVAAVVLTHPAHGPAAGVLVLLAAWCSAAPRWAAAGRAVAALGLAAGVAAFWALPLVTHLEHTRALAWGSLSVRETLLGHPLAWALVVLVAAGSWPRARLSPTVALLRIFPWVMVIVVFVDAFVLERLGLRWLPADRILDSAWLAFVLAGGAAAGRVVGAASAGRPRARTALSLAAVGVAVLLALPGRTLTLWPRASEWPRYETIERGMRLDALWSTLRAAPAGRVLFVRSGVPLVYSSEWWRPHSHVTALTPLATGRAIVNGTFTHPSPVAALLYRGDAGRGAIRELVERLDGRRLFGRALDELDSGVFNAYADRLGVSVVVALDEDVPHLRSLRDNPLFPHATPSPPFVVYTRRSPVALPLEVAPGLFRLTAEAPPETWLPTRMAYYPLWHATSEGHAIPTRRGALGDLEVRAPRAGTVIDLIYERGLAETTGMVVAAASLFTLAIMWTGQRVRRRRAAIAAKSWW